MTEQEARRILGVSPEADFDEIKKRYRRLMLQVHPDTDIRGEKQLTAHAQRNNLAYETLKRGNCGKSFSSPHQDQRTGQKENQKEKQEKNRGTHAWKGSRPRWDAPVNLHAYSEREILHYAEDADGSVLGSFCIAKGKYLWTVEEDFPLFLLSISRCAKALLDEAEDSLYQDSLRRDSLYFRKGAADTVSSFSSGQTLPRSQVLTDLVYLLAQQFIDSTGLLEQLAKRKTADSSGNPVFYLPAMLETAPCLLPPEGGTPLYPARLNRHRLYLKDASGQELGYLSFPDDRLYYVIIPLFEQRLVQVRIRAAGTQETASQPGKMQRNRKKKDAGRYRHLHLWIRFSSEAGSSLPENLNLQIERLLAEYRQAL